MNPFSILSFCFLLLQQEAKQAKGEAAFANRMMEDIARRMAQTDYFVRQARRTQLRGPHSPLLDSDEDLSWMDEMPLPSLTTTATQVDTDELLDLQDGCIYDPDDGEAHSRRTTGRSRQTEPSGKDPGAQGKGLKPITVSPSSRAISRIASSKALMPGTSPSTARAVPSVATNAALGKSSMPAALHHEQPVNVGKMANKIARLSSVMQQSLLPAMQLDSQLPAQDIPSQQPGSIPAAHRRTAESTSTVQSAQVLVPGALAHEPSKHPGHVGFHALPDRDSRPATGKSGRRTARRAEAIGSEASSSYPRGRQISDAGQKDQAPSVGQVSNQADMGISSRGSSSSASSIGVASSSRPTSAAWHLASAEINSRGTSRGQAAQSRPSLGWSSSRHEPRMYIAPVGAEAHFADGNIQQAAADSTSANANDGTTWTSRGLQDEPGSMPTDEAGLQMPPVSFSFPAAVAAAADAAHAVQAQPEVLRLDDASRSSTRPGSSESLRPSTAGHACAEGPNRVGSPLLPDSRAHMPPAPRPHSQAHQASVNQKSTRAQADRQSPQSVQAAAKGRFQPLPARKEVSRPLSRTGHAADPSTLNMSNSLRVMSLK